tara:strand:+ start:156 stop:284 length:129 start_codon:yes stop_codon:yes gene_type:complete
VVVVNPLVVEAVVKEPLVKLQLLIQLVVSVEQEKQIQLQVQV